MLWENKISVLSKEGKKAQN